MIKIEDELWEVLYSNIFRFLNQNFPQEYNIWVQILIWRLLSRKPVKFSQTGGTDM